MYKVGTVQQLLYTGLPVEQVQWTKYPNTVPQAGQYSVQEILCTGLIVDSLNWSLIIDILVESPFPDLLGLI